MTDINISNHDLNLLMQIPAILSIIGTLLVIFVYTKFTHLRQYRHVELAFYVALNDFCAAIEVGVGKVRNGSPACWFQSIGTSYSFLASVFWSSVITYQIYVIVHKGRIIEDLTMYHRFCWLFPLLIVLLPLTTNNYGSGSDSWCFLGDRHGSPPDAIYVWILLSFFVWLWLALGFIAIVFLLLILGLRDVNTAEAMAAYRPLYRLAAYPMVLILCWTLPSFLVIYGSIMKERYEGPGTGIIHALGAALPPLQGFLLSTAFFVVNESARSSLKNWLSSFLPLKPPPPDSSNIESARPSSFATITGGNSRETLNITYADDAFGRSTGSRTTGSRTTGSIPVRPGGSSASSSQSNSGSSGSRSMGWLARAANANVQAHAQAQAGTGSQHSVADALAVAGDNAHLLNNLAQRDMLYERGSDSYWSNPSTDKVAAPKFLW